MWGAQEVSVEVELEQFRREDESRSNFSVRSKHVACGVQSTSDMWVEESRRSVWCAN